MNTPSDNPPTAGTTRSRHSSAGSVVGVNEQLIVLIVVVGGVYLLSCLFWPYTKCGSCKGGKHFSPGGSAWRKCGRCRGSGRQRRLGARLFSSEDA